VIGLDTNVLIRLFLAEDDPGQHDRSVALMRDRAVSARINLVVLAEAVWTLQRNMGRSRAAAADFVQGVLDAESIEIEADRIVRQALADFRIGPADFADYLIARLNAERGCPVTYTFDTKAAKSPLFQLVP
jgi:predicted nucleic-acid-binding protein